MKRLIIYKSGERYIMDGMSLTLHSGVIDQEIDLEKATPLETTQLTMNPYDDLLLDEIKKRNIEI